MTFFYRNVIILLHIYKINKLSVIFIKKYYSKISEKKWSHKIRKMLIFVS